jgi:hypothetical protein
MSIYVGIINQIRHCERERSNPGFIATFHLNLCCVPLKKGKKTWIASLALAMTPNYYLIKIKEFYA